MGIYRYILAVLVLLSHCGISFYGYNQGVVSVISFFLISGYVITLLIKKHYARREDIHYFYADRILRLFPQFIFYLLLTTLLLSVLGNFNASDNIEKFIVNLTMIPLNFFAVYNDNFIIVPQSWSLGLEMQFYILFPLALSFYDIKKGFILSLSMFLVAYCQVINPDYYGYRMITGTFFIFCLGSMLTNPSKNKLNISFSYVLIAILFIGSTYMFDTENKRMTEVLFGVLTGLPIVCALIKYNVKSKFDLLMGNLSYGVYLNHMMIALMFSKAGLDITNPVILVIFIFSSTLLSYVSFKYIEAPIYRFRHFLRYKHETVSESENQNKFI